jgi:STE24 endopeptidase
MNVYAVIILGALLFQYGLDLVAQLLNLHALDEKVPASFEEVYDDDAYRRSQAYTRANTQFDLIASTFDLGVLLAFWFAGGFAWLDGFVRGWNLGPIWTGLIYIGALGGAKAVLSLPFQLYSTFVLEERFGFNQTSARTFVLDRLKGLGLSLLLGGPLLAAMLWFFGATGPYGWVYAWVTVTAVVLLLQFAAPRYLMPLFNTFEPVRDDDLRDRILSYARSVDLSVDDVFVMDGSRRSSKSNAFFAGLGANRRIVLFDTLLEKLSSTELLTVVAHEVGHYKRHHIPQRIGISVVHMGVLFLLLSIFLQVEGLYAAFYVDQIGIYTGLVFFGLLYTPVELLLSLPMQALSRKHEFEADAFAVKTTGEPEAFTQALKKLAEQNLSNLTPHPFYVQVYYSHPPLHQRVASIEAQSPTAAAAARR